MERLRGSQSIFPDLKYMASLILHTAGKMNRMHGRNFIFIIQLLGHCMHYTDKAMRNARTAVLYV